MLINGIAMDAKRMGFGPVMPISFLGGIDHQKTGIFVILDPSIPNMNGLLGFQDVYFGAGNIAQALARLQDCPCLNSGGRYFFDLSFSYTCSTDAEPNMLEWLKAKYGPVCMTADELT